MIYQGAHGVRELGKPTPMTDDTVFWVASMTKAVTAAAAMQLVERGQLALDAPASEVIPYLGQVQVCEGFEADGQPRLRPPRGRLRYATADARRVSSTTYGTKHWRATKRRNRRRARVPGRNVRSNCRWHSTRASWEYGMASIGPACSSRS